MAAGLETHSPLQFAVGLANCDNFLIKTTAVIDSEIEREPWDDASLEGDKLPGADRDADGHEVP